MSGTKQSIGYYENDRADLVSRLPRPLGRVLDVGCGAGAVGRLLRAQGAQRLVGIELDQAAAARAKEIYDEVHVGSAEVLVQQLEEQFDTVLCYDVLEHLVDPWRVLHRLNAVTAPGGHLHVSVPNARHLSLAYDVYLRGTFGYVAWGHRDDTHLRWFTPRDIERSIGDARFAVVATSHPPISRARRVLGRITGGWAIEFLVWQWHVLATRPATS